MERNAFCNICRRKCRLVDNGPAGYCGGWAMVDGKLENVAYGRLALVQREPVSQIPLMSWRGRNEALSLATYGCSTRCIHCTNREYSHLRLNHQGLLKLPVLAPEDLVQMALADNTALATDFVEPVNLLKYVQEAFSLARSQGVPTILGTAGWLTGQSLRKILPMTTVLRLDLKGGTSEALLSQGFVGLTSDHVMESAWIAKELGVITEITICVIPGVNDSQSELLAMTRLLEGLEDIPITLVGHWKGGDRDPFPVARAEDIDYVSDFLRAKINNSLFRMEVLDVQDCKT